MSVRYLQNQDNDLLSQAMAFRDYQMKLQDQLLNEKMIQQNIIQSQAATEHQKMMNEMLRQQVSESTSPEEQARRQKMREYESRTAAADTSRSEVSAATAVTRDQREQMQLGIDKALGPIQVASQGLQKDILGLEKDRNKFINKRLPIKAKQEDELNDMSRKSMMADLVERGVDPFTSDLRSLMEAPALKMKVRMGEQQLAKEKAMTDAALEQTKQIKMQNATERVSQLSQMAMHLEPGQLSALADVIPEAKFISGMTFKPRSMDEVMAHIVGKAYQTLQDPNAAPGTKSDAAGMIEAIIPTKDKAGIQTDPTTGRVTFGKSSEESIKGYLKALGTSSQGATKLPKEDKGGQVQSLPELGQEKGQAVSQYSTYVNKIFDKSQWVNKNGKLEPDVAPTFDASPKDTVFTKDEDYRGYRDDVFNLLEGTKGFFGGDNKNGIADPMKKRVAALLLTELSKSKEPESVFQSFLTDKRTSQLFDQEQIRTFGDFAKAVRATVDNGGVMPKGWAERLFSWM